MWNSLDIGKIALYDSNINDIILAYTDSKVKDNTHRKVYLSIIKQKDLETSKSYII
jgi:hypothetical protein